MTQGAAIQHLRSAILRLDLRTRLMIVIAIEIAYMASSRVIYHYPDLTLAEVEMLRTSLRLFAALAFWLLMADVIFSRERNLRPLRRPLVVVGLVLAFASATIVGADDQPLYDTIVICLATISVGVHEEIFFRGILQTLLVSRFGLVPGIGLMVSLFVGFHIGVTPDNFLNFTNIALAGLLLGLLYAGTGSLLAVVVFHTLYDTLASSPDILSFIPLSWVTPTLALGTWLVAIGTRAARPRRVGPNHD